MRDAQVRRLPVVSDMGGLVGAISIDDLVLVAQNVRASADAASVFGFHAVGRVEWRGRGVNSLARFRDGVDHLFVAALVASGVRRAGIDPAPPHGRGQSPGPLCERGDQPMVVWEAGARRKSTPRAGTKPIGVLLPVLPMRPPRARGDQTNVRYMLIRADGPGRQSCHLRRSVQLRPKARGDRRGAEDSPMRHSLTRESGIGARQMSRAHVVRTIGGASWR